MSNQKTFTKQHTKIMDKTGFMVKRCPHCSTTLALDEYKCPSCKSRVGDPDKLGVATVPGRWKAYVTFAIAFVILASWFVYGRDIIAAVKMMLGG